MDEPTIAEFDSSFQWLQTRIGPSNFDVTELFHYTNQTGFLGILKEQRIRATHVGHLNDRSEVEHAAQMIKDHVQELRNKPSPVLPNLLDWMLTALHGMTAQKTGLFVVSFSGIPDSLPQWDRYSPDFGYALGFDRTLLELVNRVSENDVRPARLIRILYSHADKLELVTETISNLLDRANAVGLVGFTTKQTWTTWNMDFLRCLSLLLTGLKHEAYQSEEEFRLVVLHDPRFPTLAREGRHGIATYVNLEPRDLDRLPLTSVVVGPSHYPESAKFAVQQLLVRTLGVDAIRNSTVPKRT
jgi:hypothetical protein